MKHFRIRKNKESRKPLIHEIRITLPKPKFPRIIFWIYNNRS